MRKLDRDWQADLAEHNLPHFHANELREHSSRLYRGISNRKREKLLSRLIGHIHKRTDWGLSAFIDSEYYKKNTSDRFRSQWGTAYTFAMRMLILTLQIQLTKANREGEPINVLIEQGHANEGQALHMLKEFRAFADKRINIISFGSGPKNGNPVLQAADLLAFGTCEQLRGDKSRILGKLLSNRRPEYFDIDCNAQIVEAMKETVAGYFAKRKATWLESRKTEPITETTDA